MTQTQACLETDSTNSGVPDRKIIVNWVRTIRSAASTTKVRMKFEDSSYTNT